MKQKANEILIFLSKQHRTTTSQEISNALHISIRSVKSYIQEINSFYGKKIILSSRSGYELSEQFSIGSLTAKGEKEKIPDSLEERAFYIIKKLIIGHATHLNIFDLCEYFYISYSSMKSIISKMNKMFSNYHVAFVSKGNDLQIQGDEKDKRKLISYVISEEARNSFVDLRQLQNCFTNIDISKLNKLVVAIFKKHNYYLNDFATINLLLHLAIIIDRELNNYSLKSSKVLFDTKSTHEKALLSELCMSIEELFHIQLNKFEINEIYLLFKANANYSLPTTKAELKQTIGEEIIELTQYYIDKINSLYMINLSENSFFAPFSLHLKNLLFRAKNNTYTTNPLVNSIKLNSPIIFDIAIYIGLDLSKRYHISVNEDEVAFLAMHIGAEIERQGVNRSKTPAILVCPNYRDLSANILNKLLLTFGNQINIIRSIHNEDEMVDLQNEMALYDSGLLFTTIPIASSHAFTTITISPFQLESQFALIQEMIYKNTQQRKTSNLQKNFGSFFEETLFVSDLDLSQKEAIHYLCELLREKKYVNDTFEDEIIRRETAATTSFGNIAIPHSVEMDALKTSVAVMISKNGIVWSGNTVYIILLLAINKADKNSFRELYESLIELFNKAAFIKEIRNCKSFEEFQRYIYTPME